ncbi:MAG: DUF2971 domain-containing protein [Lachnospiraceae bacterium]|jgi:hypothetical protein|nr:DUF2971 domain-containing protein [Lachnospiraceae bacterium]MCI9132793.1 DUF2971 domain-containing protein [Lachnospiraceae bacterium]
MAGYEKDILYHYTDFQALDGILRCAQLRVNNVLNMNDAAEMRLFMTGLCDAVMKRLKKEGDQERGGKVRLLFQEELKKEFFYSAYAACFSLYRDDAAQWERYGNRGRGVCIAFRGDYLEKMAEGELSLQTVFYQDDMTEHHLVDVFYRLVKGETKIKGDNPRIKGAMKAAWIQSVVFKHPSFSSEKEVRLVVSPFEKEYFDVEPCYHVTIERIKKYYPLDLMSMCRKIGIGLEDLISEIIIGPESTQSQSILQDYLRDNGLKGLAERVSLSSCPLRRPPV